VIDGEIYVIGGYGSNNDIVGSVEKYSPASDTWSTVAPLPVGRVDHPTVVVGSVINILGGETEESVLQFNSVEGTWSVVAPMPVPRDKFASCAYMSDIYIFGGYDERGDAPGAVFKFDTMANEWSTQTPMPTECGCCSASLIDDKVYITGAGVRGCDVLCFDFATDQWSTLAHTIYDRTYSVSFVLARCLYVAGGGDYVNASVERYDVVTTTWTAVAHMLEGRLSFGAVCIKSEDPAEEQDLFDALIANC
jgi:hypothetical protein